MNIRNLFMCAGLLVSVAIPTLGHGQSDNNSSTIQEYNTELLRLSNAWKHIDSMNITELQEFMRDCQKLAILDPSLKVKLNVYINSVNLKLQDISSQSSRKIAIKPHTDSHDHQNNQQIKKYVVKHHQTAIPWITISDKAVKTSTSSVPIANKPVKIGTPWVSISGKPLEIATKVVDFNQIKDSYSTIKDDTNKLLASIVRAKKVDPLPQSDAIRQQIQTLKNKIEQEDKLFLSGIQPTAEAKNIMFAEDMRVDALYAIQALIVKYNSIKTITNKVSDVKQSYGKNHFDPLDYTWVNTAATGLSGEDIFNNAKLLQEELMRNQPISDKATFKTKLDEVIKEYNTFDKTYPTVTDEDIAYIATTEQVLENILTQLTNNPYGTSLKNRDFSSVLTNHLDETKSVDSEDEDETPQQEYEVHHTNTPNTPTVTYHHVISYNNSSLHRKKYHDSNSHHRRHHHKKHHHHKHDFTSRHITHNHHKKHKAQHNKRSLTHSIKKHNRNKAS